METGRTDIISKRRAGIAPTARRAVASLLCAAFMLQALPVRAQTPEETPATPDGKPRTEAPDPTGMTEPYLDAEMLVRTPFEAEISTEEPDTATNVVVAPGYDADGHKIFNPDPTRAVWMSALFPGLGQVYNRRWWKLPIIVGGFMGLGYATTWNNNQYQDYTQGYRDLLDDDPDTKSYMNFFPPTTSEDSLDKNWLTSVMKSRRDYYRRNRDLCIICIVGVYLLCMLDAYVDASMAHFDISPDLSMEVGPGFMLDPSKGRVAVGMNWAITF